MGFINETLIRLYCWARAEPAQTMTDYALVLSMVSIVSVIILMTLSAQIGPFFSKVTDALGVS